MDKYFRTSTETDHKKCTQAKHPITRLQDTVTQIPDPGVTSRLLTASKLEHEKNCIQTVHPFCNSKRAVLSADPDVPIHILTGPQMATKVCTQVGHVVSI